MAVTISTYFNITECSNASVTNATGVMEGSSSASLMTIFSACYGIICVGGLVGNGLVMFVIARHATQANSVTNAYIVNLAIADSCFLTGLPFLITTATVKRWVFGFWFCKLFFTLTSVNWFTSVFTLTVMSVDRYLAVCHPIRSMAWRTVGLSRVICACIWLTSLLVMLPIILHATVYEDEEGVRSCTLTWHSPSVDPWTAFIIYTCLLGFAAPVSLISVFYTLVVCRLRRPRPAPSSISSKQRDKSRNRITRLVLVIIAVYVTCWLPYWIFQVGLTMRVFTDLPPWGYTIYQAITVLSYANSMLNPLLYVFLTEKFRQNLTAACCCSAPSRAKQLQQQGNATKAKVNKEQTETFLSPENKQVTMLDSVNTQDSRITGHSALHYSHATTISELSSPTVL